MKHVKHSITTLILVLSATSWSAAQNRSAYDQNRPIGWGTVDGVITGSEDENPVVVTTQGELEAAFDKKSKTAKKTIYIKGVIKVSGQFSIKDQENKTIYGLPGAAFENTTHSTVKDESGIIQLSLNLIPALLQHITDRIKEQITGQQKQYKNSYDHQPCISYELKIQIE